MSEIARSLGRENTAREDGRSEAALFARLRDILPQMSPTTTMKVRAEFAPEERAKVGSLLRWLDKNKEVGLSKEGSTTVVTWGRPAIQPQIAAPMFREGRVAAEATVLDLSLYPPSQGDDEWGLRLGGTAAIESFESAPEGKGYILETTHIPVKNRVPGITQTIALTDRTWLIGKGRRESTGREETPAFIQMLDGTSTSAPLEHAASRVFRASGGEHFITLDRNLVVRVLDADGALRLTISLAQTPEVTALVESYGSDTPHRIVRAVDVSFSQRQILIAVVNRVIRYTFEGEVVSAFMLPGILGAGSSGGKEPRHRNASLRLSKTTAGRGI